MIGPILGGLARAWRILKGTGGALGGVATADYVLDTYNNNVSPEWQVADISRLVDMARVEFNEILGPGTVPGKVLEILGISDLATGVTETDAELARARIEDIMSGLKLAAEGKQVVIKEPPAPKKPAGPFGNSVPLPQLGLVDELMDGEALRDLFDRAGVRMSIDAADDIRKVIQLLLEHPTLAESLKYYGRYRR